MFNLIFLILTVVIFFFMVGIIIDLNRQRELFFGFTCIIITSVCLLLWSGIYILYMAEPIPKAALVLYRTRILGQIFFVPFYFLFILFFNNKNFELRKGLSVLIFAIPIITLLSAITDASYHFVYRELNLINVLPYKELKVQYGIIKNLFWMYTVVIEIIALVVFIIRFRNVAAIYKTQVGLFIFATLASLLSLYINYNVNNNGMDIYLLGCSIKNLVTYWALVKYDTSDFMILAKDTVFEKISCVALVLDNDGKIIDSNPMANELFDSLDIELRGVKYQNVLERWIRAKNGVLDETKDGRMMYFRSANNMFYYSITEVPISDKKNRLVGVFVEMRDVTRQQQLIKELFYLVNHDQLTGIYNRRYFEQMCKELDNHSNYPLGIISGDLNKLKTTNDTYGHAAGDRLIVLIAEVLKRSMPKSAIVSRHGGDEFFILLPSTSEDNIKYFINRVHENAASVHEEPFGSPSISLGYALKSNSEENLEHIMSIADMRMYEDKQKHHMKMVR